MHKTKKIILFVETATTYGRELVYGIAKYSRFHGPWEFYNESFAKDKVAHKLDDWGADGIIIRVSKRTKELLKMGLPTIFSPCFEPPMDGLPNIIPDDQAIAEMAAEHLLSQGFKKFAFCGFDKMDWSHERGVSFSKRVAEAGYETFLYIPPKSKGALSWEKEQGHMSKWLKSLPKPIGLMACDDNRGQHVLEACKLANLYIPEEVAVVGVDNDRLICTLAAPPLSSIALNIEKGGYEAAKLLDQLMAGKKVSDQKILVHPTHVVIRQSTNTLAIEDANVAQAVRFIRKHAREMIQVDRVVEEVAVSRRTLQQKIQKTLGHSIHREICRARLDQIIQLLIQTNEPISRIAVVLNYANIEHLNRFFKKETGMSPVKYRRQFESK